MRNEFGTLSLSSVEKLRETAVTQRAMDEIMRVRKSVSNGKKRGTIE